MNYQRSDFRLKVICDHSGDIVSQSLQPYSGPFVVN